MDRADGHLLEHPGVEARVRRRYSVGFARNADEVRAAKQLRWRVFSDELGARARGSAASLPGTLISIPRIFFCCCRWRA